MTRTDLLVTFESCLEEPPEPGTLSGEEVCSDLDGWNSLSVLAFISVINKEHGIILPPAKIFGCRRVDDVIDLVVSLMSS